MTHKEMIYEALFAVHFRLLRKLPREHEDRLRLRSGDVFEVTHYRGIVLFITRLSDGYESYIFGDHHSSYFKSIKRKVP